MPSVRVLEGDCLDHLEALPENSVDAVVCDPPYGLGFMGKHWDHAENVAFRPETWAKVLRVLKPGGHLVAFSGTRTYHRMACAIEDAGYEVRDQLAFCYGTGFPKSHNIGNGFGTALKPAWEPICLARKPLSEPTVAANVLKWGTGALNIDGCRVETDENLNGGRYSDNKIGDDGNSYGSGINRRSALDYTQPSGRWPANIVHDGSEEVVGAFPVTTTNPGTLRSEAGRGHIQYAPHRPEGTVLSKGDSGSAARFFYSAKASKADRCGSKHPTVKPVSLMRWLCRLVTPKGGTILDPFAGSGTTGAAAHLEGFNAILIEREAEYVADIKRRIASLAAEAPLFEAAE
jgi:site-specific DNA-methyltransferase (adenine-specific)